MRWRRILEVDLELIELIRERNPYGKFRRFLPVVCRWSKVDWQLQVEVGFLKQNIEIIQCQFIGNGLTSCPTRNFLCLTTRIIDFGFIELIIMKNGHIIIVCWIGCETAFNRIDFSDEICSTNNKRNKFMRYFINLPFDTLKSCSWMWMILSWTTNWCTRWCGSWRFFE